jgi:hypothetical protein
MRISNVAYSGGVIVKSYEILSDDANSIVCSSGHWSMSVHGMGWGGLWVCPNTSDTDYAHQI